MTSVYLQYGISSELANKLISLGLPKTTFEKTSKKNLIEKYGLSKEEVLMVQKLIKRHPIDENTIERLLENSNFVCCVCRGVKGKSYIIHHIEEYSVSQNNEYHNLAVLCPNDHDLAHRNGRSLTLGLTKDQIIKAKMKWEAKVQEINIEQASKNGNIIEIDFLNIPRILEVCIELYGNIPETSYTQELRNEDLITPSGHLNLETIKLVNKNPATPLIFFGLFGSSSLRYHYYEIFQEGLLNHLQFKDLDTLLNKTSLKKGIVGEYCYYVGGLYSERLPDPITDDSNLMRFFLNKKQFRIEWLVDARYFCSSTAKNRTYHRNVYMIFGKIRNVNIAPVNGKDKIVIDIRPYCFGMPDLQKYRTPDIAYRDKFDDFFNNEEA